jgi:hypothetical protein
MRSLKKRASFILACSLIMLAVGTAAGDILPESSYYSGTSYYNGTTDGIVLEFSVYDRDTLAGEDEMEFSSNIEMEGQYIYAYQIYNGNGSNVDISEFSIFGIGNDPDYAVDDESQISTMEDTFNDPGQEATGVDAYNYGLSANHSQVAWYFAGGSGVIGVGDHSYYLIIVSDHDMTFGTYNFTGIQDDVVAVPDGEGEQVETIPEPCTIALLGIGGLILRRTGKRSK